MVIVSLPYASIGTSGLGGLRSFAHRWEGNASLFALVRWPLDLVLADEGAMELSPWLVRVIRSVVGGEGQALNVVQADEVAFGITKILMLAIFLTSAVLVLRKAKDIVEAFAPCMLILCLVSPILHPWYLIWVLPFAVIVEAGTPKWWSRPTIVWCLTAWIAYLPRPDYLETGVWHPSTGPVWLEYLPVYGLMGWSLWQVRQASERDKVAG